MKKNTLLLGIILLIVLLNYSCEKSTTLENEYLVNGEIIGLTEGRAVLSILELGSNKRRTIDSTKIVNGKFTFAGKLHSPYLHFISINDTVGKIHFFLENSKIDIKADVDSLKNARVIGSREDSLFRLYSFSAIFDEEIGMEVMKKYPSYVFSALVAYYQFPRLKIARMDSIMDNFDPLVRKSTYYQHLSKIYERVKAVNVSKAVPEFNLADVDGNEVKSSDFNGAYLLISFGASYQRYYNPTLVHIYDKFQNRNFNMVSISVDENREEWIRVIKEDSLVWTNVSALNGWGAITDLYGVKYIPQNLLVNPNGEIIRRNIKYEELEMVLQTTLPQ